MAQRISMAHGEGGELTHELIKNVFMKYFHNQTHARLDAAILPWNSNEIVMTTDSYVVKPIFFPGGDIGKLAITGTVNDLAVSGAKPVAITAGFIIEEGFSIRDLKEIVKSMALEAEHAGVQIIAGDTKVVERGSADGVFINTTGIGQLFEQRLEPDAITEGDTVIISGPVGEHGVAIMSARKELGLITDMTSDCASLHHFIEEVVTNVKGVRVMRDPTRGGLATTLVELCEDFRFDLELEESWIPVPDAVHGACDILGFDPLYLANEGKVVFIVEAEQAKKMMEVIKSHPLGASAQVIGRVKSCDNASGKLYLKTPIGTTRRLFRLSGMLLPRIC
ncbi:hydrogenase expression/formation protein HypE [Jeotgalibacillus haloalkalitolerans]|uniref:Hydrogenase expression/formation protein HypE n=1 Tax=Jeotgalibacillus haloalkalitolerans TaxID=3104292 RepID=A0ABU5KNL2_9BACL|nr:hydrogenase expression/formation protein HypE [Jeotgalibacillus sp. HH7-29]MDZ5712742.1 hydrogenase expression/formation protein HypE [Jeotgalibacillus sp. HH7-29]